MLATTNFNTKTDPKLLCTCGHESCNRRRVRQPVLDRLQLIRDDYGLPMLVTSGGRCPYHFKEVHKRKAGDHQKGYAVDIAYSGELQRNKLLVLAGRYGATRVAVGRAFIHMSWMPTDNKSVPTWSYVVQQPAKGSLVCKTS